MSKPPNRQETEKAIGGRLYSALLKGQLEDLSRVRRALLFAELANIVYLHESLAWTAALSLGFTSYTYFDQHGAQAFIFETDVDCVLVCRGTEPTDWNDIKADVNASAVVAETIGHVHSGFKQEVDDLWPELENALINTEKRLWIAGHSLGGAMATIIASRCTLAHIQTKPIEMHTYGSPRVGDKTYVDHTDVIHIRWVNNNDIITRMPPRWLRYVHTGQEMYINAYGQIRSTTPWQRTKDRWRGFWMGLQAGGFDVLSDHLMDNYIQHINSLCITREQLARGDSPFS